MDGWIYVGSRPLNSTARHWAFTSEDARMCPVLQNLRDRGILRTLRTRTGTHEYSIVARQITHEHNNYKFRNTELQHSMPLIITLLTFLCEWHHQRRSMLQQTDDENLCIESVPKPERGRMNAKNYRPYRESLAPFKRQRERERERERSPEEQMEGNIYE